MKYAFLLLSFLLTGLVLQASPPAGDGKAIFAARCASCHNVHKILTGPALAGVDERRPMNWIISFVHSSQTLVRGGDKTANELFEQFNRVQMPDHPDLTEEKIRSIVEYIKVETKAGAEKPPFARPGKLHPNNKPLSLPEDISYLATYVLLVGLLIVSLVFAVQVKEYERSRKGS
ncbi:MAG: hypothetical protein JWP27_1783 [Flaviaesturariibacter sp.]|nr:hypothetical protein [Flaviaesturariibacter sp.]